MTALPKNRIMAITQERRLFLNGLFKKHDALKDAQLGKCFTTKFDRSVFGGTLKGRRVVFKLLSTERQEFLVQCVQAEMEFVRKYMKTGPYRVNRLMQAYPQDGLIVIDFVPGRTIGQEIADATPDQRKQLLRRVGEWLAHYTKPRRRSDCSFNAKAWIMLLRLNFTNPPMGSAPLSNPDDIDLAQALYDALERQALGLSGVTSTNSAQHGDLQLGNLICRPEIFVGIDINGERRAPIAKDLALFLVDLQTSIPLQTDDHRYGIAASDMDALLQCGLLAESEISKLFPFILGCELFNKFVLYSQDGSVRKLGRSTIQRYLKNMASG